MSEGISEKLLYDAAGGNTAALADWIESNKSVEGIPYPLIAELIRNSAGCKKPIKITEILDVRFGEAFDSEGNPQTYVSRRSGVLKYTFKPAVKEVGRPSQEARNRKIVEKYTEYLKTLSKEMALDKLAKEFKREPATINSIIAETRARRLETVKIIEGNFSYISDE